MKTIYIICFTIILPYCYLNGQNNKYAFLINTAYNKELNHVEYYNELVRLYDYLINDLDYIENNIFIYNADGTDTGEDSNLGFYIFQNSDPDLDGDGDDDITGPSYFDTISNKFSNLDFLDDDDFLFVYLTGPLKEVFSGGIWNPWDYYRGMAFWDSDLRTNHALSGPMMNLSPANLLFIDARRMDGINISSYDGVNRYIIKSMTYTMGTNPSIPESSYFGKYLLDALIGEDSDGNSVSADYDNSGITTIKEAFSYAVNQVSQDYSDAYWYDELKASNISLNGYEGCQSIYTIIPGIVSGTENYEKCNVIIDGLAVVNGGQLHIEADGSVIIEKDFAVEAGGYLDIQ